MRRMERELEREQGAPAAKQPAKAQVRRRSGFLSATTWRIPPAPLAALFARLPVSTAAEAGS